MCMQLVAFQGGAAILGAVAYGLVANFWAVLCPGRIIEDRQVADSWDDVRFYIWGL